MPEALWSQAVGVTYTAAEDRKLIDALWTEGIVKGLVLTVSGLAATFTPGYVAVSDDAGGSFLAYFPAGDANLSKVLPSNGTTVFYVKIADASGVGTAVATIEATVPTGFPWAQIASVTTVAGAVAGSITQYQAAISAATASVKKSGDTMTGELTAPSIHVPGYLQVNATLGYVNAPSGVRIGAASAPTKRVVCRVSRTTARDFPNNTYSDLFFNSEDLRINDYGTQDQMYNKDSGSGVFKAPVTGIYEASAVVVLTDTTGAGQRYLLLERNTAAGALIEKVFLYVDYTKDTTAGNSYSFMSGSASIYMVAGELLNVSVYQNSGSTKSLHLGTYSDGNRPRLMISLGQVV